MKMLPVACLYTETIHTHTRQPQNLNILLNYTSKKGMHGGPETKDQFGVALLISMYIVY